MDVLPAALRPFFTANPPCPKLAFSKLERACFPRRFSEKNCAISSRSSLKQSFTVLRFTPTGEAVWGRGIYALCKAAENSAAFYADKRLYVRAMQIQHLLFAGQ